MFARKSHGTLNRYVVAVGKSGMAIGQLTEGIVCITSCTRRFASTMVAEGNLQESGPLGSGRLVSHNAAESSYTCKWMSAHKEITVTNTVNLSIPSESKIPVCRPVRCSLNYRPGALYSQHNLIKIHCISLFGSFQLYPKISKTVLIFLYPSDTHKKCKKVVNTWPILTLGCTLLRPTHAVISHISITLILQ